MSKREAYKGNELLEKILRNELGEEETNLIVLVGNRNARYYVKESGGKIMLEESEINTLKESLYSTAENIVHANKNRRSAKTVDGKLSNIYMIAAGKRILSNPIVRKLIEEDESRTDKSIFYSGQETANDYSYKSLINEYVKTSGEEKRGQKKFENDRQIVENMYYYWIHDELESAKKDDNSRPKVDDPEAEKEYDIIRIIRREEMKDPKNSRYGTLLKDRYINIANVVLGSAAGTIDIPDLEYILQNFTFSKDEKNNARYFLGKTYGTNKIQDGDVSQYIPTFASLCGERGVFESGDDVLDIIRLTDRVLNSGIVPVNEPRKIDDIEKLLSYKNFVNSLSNISILKLYLTGYKNIDIDTIKSRKMNEADIWGLYSPYALSYDNIIMLGDGPRLYPDINECLTGRDIMALVEQNLVSSKRLVDVYEKQEEIKDAPANGPYSDYSDVFADNSDIFSHFNASRILSVLKDEEYKERFLDMYFRLRESCIGKKDEHNRQYQTAMLDKYKKEQNDEDITEDAVFLFQNGIIDLDVLYNYVSSLEYYNVAKTAGLGLEEILKNEVDFAQLSQEDLKELYINSNADKGSIIPYLIAETIEEMCLEDNIKISEIFDELAKGNIHRDIVFSLMTHEEARTYLRDGDAKPSSVLDAYMKGYITFNDLRNIGIEKDDSKDTIDKKGKIQYGFGITKDKMNEYIDNLVLPTDPEKREVYLQHLEELFVNEELSYEDVLERLYNAQPPKITQDEYERLFNVRYDIAINRLGALNSIVNGAFPIGQSNPNPGPVPLPGPKKTHVPVIDPIYIEQLLNAFSIDNKGTPDMKRIEILEGALDGYTLIILNNMKVGILEKINQDGKSRDATFVVPVIHAEEISKKESKGSMKTLQGDRHIITVYHTRNYAENLRNAISKMQEQQQLSKDNPDITWAKDKTDPNRETAIKNATTEIQDSFDRNSRLR